MQNTDISSFFSVMSAAEFREKEEQLAYYKEMLRSLGAIRYCKAEMFKHCILGTIRIPQKNEQKKALFSFGFYLTENKVIFVEDGVKTGGISEYLEALLLKNGFDNTKILAFDEKFYSHGTRQDVLKEAGLDIESIYNTLLH